MQISVCYFSATGRTAAMAKAVAEGVSAFDPGCRVRCFPLEELTREQPENIAFVNESDGVILGTPDYYAGESWQVKKWLDACPCKLGGKLAGCFATANFPVGGAVVAIEHVLTHLLVQGAMVYSGGSACGQPFIHLGPVCYRDGEEQALPMMRLFGERFARQAAAVSR